MMLFLNFNIFGKPKKISGVTQNEDGNFRYERGS